MQAAASTAGGDVTAAEGSSDGDADGSAASRSSVETRKRGRRPAVDAAKDQLIRDAMQRHGTTNARIIQDELARAHSVQLTYEAVRKRVRQLSLQTASASVGGQDNAAAAAASAVEAENANVTKKKTKTSEQPTATDANTAGTPERKALADSSVDHLRIARDLDMLAETVRTIVSSVRGHGESEPDGSAYAGEERENDDESGSISADSASGEDSDFTEDMSGSTIQKKTKKKPANEAPLPSAASSQSTDDDAVAALPLATRRRKYGEYSMELREACVRKHEEEGLTYATISRQLNIPHDTVRAIVRKMKRTGSVRTAPRSGRPRKMSDIVDKVIVQAVKKNRRCTAKMIRDDLLTDYNVKVSCETVRRRVKAYVKNRLVPTLVPIETTQQHPLAAPPVSPATSTLPTSMGTFSPTTSVPPAASSSTPAPSIGPYTSSPIPLMPLPGEGCDQIPQSVFASHGAIYSILNFHEHQALEQEPRVLHSPSGLRIEAPPETSAHYRTGDVRGETTVDPSSNTRKKRKDYSVEVREQCVTMHAQGHGYRRIGQKLSMPHTTVRAIVEKAQRTGTVLPAARSGRPRKTDEIVDRVILQVVRSNEKCSARMIQEKLENTFGVKVSCETIRRRVKDHSRQRHGVHLQSSSFPAIPDAIEASSGMEFVGGTEADDVAGSAEGYPASAIEALVAPAAEEERVSELQPRSFQEQLHLNDY